MQHATSLLILALLQSGWTLTPAPPREVRRLYWEVVPEMEVWVRLVPEVQERRPSVNLVFHAFYPGRAARDWYTGLPAWPQGVPSRLTISAEPPPQTIVRALSLRVTVDDRTIDFNGPDRRYRFLPCPFATDDCVPNAVEADLSPSTLRLMAAGRSVGGVALGLPFTFTPADQDAVRAFAERVGLWPAAQAPGR